MVGTATSSQKECDADGRGHLLRPGGRQRGEGRGGAATAVGEPAPDRARRAGQLGLRVHRSIDNPDEFWLYETWASEEAVEAHESGAAFQRYKEALRPLVDPDSVLFGNCVPVKVLGYSIELPAAASAPPRES